MDMPIDGRLGAAAHESGGVYGRADKAVVHVIEPNPVAQKSISWIFRSVGFDVCDYRRGRDFLESLDPNESGCIVVNMQLPDMSGVALLEELGRRGVRMPVILLTGYGEPIAAIEAFRVGAYDVVGKPFDLALVERVGCALREDARRRQSRMARADHRARLDLLTDREKEIAELVTRGDANKVIAYDLGISERTVECHRSHIMQKLGAKTLVDLVKVVVLAAESVEES